jgi:hypothetical protein
MSKSKAEDIPVDEVAEESEGSSTTEEFVVKGEELLETVKRLAHEASVRRIIVRKKDGNTLIQVPMAMGVAGLALLPAWSSLALIAALVTECSIVVVKAEKAPEKAGAV